jgi:hypothetical protein
MNSINVKEARYEDHLLTISAAMDEFEGYRQPHGKRVAAIADALAVKFNFASHDRHALGQAALIHDAGELVMNRDYIKANRPLSEQERVDMQRHTVIGEQEAAKRGLSRAVQLLVRWHHEWWNGGGYPDALIGEQIPLAARILRVADTYASMTEERPHRAAISAAEAKRYLIEWAGIEFDPKIVKYFLLFNTNDYESQTVNNVSHQQSVEKRIDEHPFAEPTVDEPKTDVPRENENRFGERQPDERLINERTIDERIIDERIIEVPRGSQSPANSIAKNGLQSRNRQDEESRIDEVLVDGQPIVEQFTDKKRIEEPQPREQHVNS